MKNKLLFSFQFRQHHYLFILKPSFTMLCLFFLLVFCMLGCWQIHRYHFKQNMLTMYQQNVSSLPQPFLTVATNPIDFLQFKPVIVKAQYDNARTLFIQNQPYQGKIGFEVITPVKVVGGNKLLLVDRGWVEKLTTKATEVNAVEQPIVGRIKLINEYRFILGKNILFPNVLPVVMQKIDIAEISQLFHQSFYPYILQLDSKSPHGFIRDWNVTIIKPERHMMYAVQWFLMAFVLCIAYFCFSCEAEELL